MSVRVPRGATGDVAGGVTEILENVEHVAAVEVHELASVSPDALDLYVDARATVAFEPAVEEPCERLGDGFGVLDVTTVAG